jgi:hypothetical protein
MLSSGAVHGHRFGDPLHRFLRSRQWRDHSSTLVCTSNPVNAVAGVATFAGCKINGVTGAGTYTLSAARSGLTSGTSSSVVIT